MWILGINSGSYERLFSKWAIFWAPGRLLNPHVKCQEFCLLNVLAQISIQSPEQLPRKLPTHAPALSNAPVGSLLYWHCVPGSLHGFCLHSASGFIISSVCVTKPSNPVVSSDYRTVCLKCRGVWDWEMAQQFRVCWPYRGHAYRSQHPRPVAHNNLCLQIQGIGCPLLACIDTCTYMCIQPSMYIEIKLNA